MATPLLLLPYLKSNALSLRLNIKLTVSPILQRTIAGDFLLNSSILVFVLSFQK